MTIPVPRPINHIGIGVPDLDAAIAWYGNCLGYRLVAGPVEMDIEQDHRGRMPEILGPIARRLRVAHLSTGGGPGVELFQTIDPPFERPEIAVQFFRAGPFHFCVTDPDVAGLAARIVATGGKQRSRVWHARPPSEEFTMTYCEDPFGTIIEIHSHPYEIVQSRPKNP
jgi:catechol 2,3-dioxygenase-like lactoylglutathione lyase family enzyme